MSNGSVKARLLLVDDDEGLLRLMEKSLSRAGYTVDKTRSGKEALDWLARHSPDLMLLDLKLADIEGRDLVAKLEAIGRTPPFVVVTGRGDEKVAVEMMKLGARDYLVKDAQFTAFLVSVVERALTQIDRDRRLRRAEEDRLRLEGELIQISEAERRRIGHELHDGVGQLLTGLSLRMQTLARRLKASGVTAADTAEQIASQLGAAVNQLRRLSHGLSPVGLESNGLTDALEELAASSDGVSGVRCVFISDPGVVIADADMATHLFRIAQEAVNNAVKHARARNIRIELKDDSAKIELRIEDDGSGLSSGYMDSAGLGLHLMPYRAKLIGGTLNISSKTDPGQSGVSVVCAVPKSKPKPA